MSTQAEQAELAADGEPFDDRTLDELQAYAEQWEIARVRAFCSLVSYAKQWDAMCAELAAVSVSDNR